MTDKIISILFEKLLCWWRKLSNGEIIILYEDGKYKFHKSKYKTFKAKIREKKKFMEFSQIMLKK